MRTQELVADLNVTAPNYGFDEIIELIALKRTQGEKDSLPAEQNAALRSRWSDLESLIMDAVENSNLPDEAPNRVEISDWLRAKRLESLSQ